VWSGIRARTAESLNVAGYVAQFALIALFLIVLRWNERQPTPDPMFFRLVVSLFVVLVTLLGSPINKLSESSIFAPVDKADTPGTSLID
jgi:amino acid transporter